MSITLDKIYPLPPEQMDPHPQLRRYFDESGEAYVAKIKEERRLKALVKDAHLEEPDGQLRRDLDTLYQKPSEDDPEKAALRLKLARSREDTTAWQLAAGLELIGVLILLSMVLYQAWVIVR